jgi:uncharacterized protein (TIGR00251 family)
MKNSEPTSDLSSAVAQTADGVVIRVHVQPKARREQIVGMHGGRIKLSVTEPPDQGKANEAVVRLVAAALNLPASRVELLRGDTSRQKDLLVRILDATEAVRLLAESMP